jgi:hypothetical protein
MEGCLQNQGYIGWRSTQGYVDFYGAALYHSQDSASCSWKYWRGAYDSTEDPLPADPEWIEPGPVSISCGVNVKWMEEYCLTSDRGATQDWIAFYWNLWTNGASRYSINQITNIWEDTGTPADPDVGTTWSDLEDSVWLNYPSDPNKRNQFFNKGLAAGVNH